MRNMLFALIVFFIQNLCAQTLVVADIDDTLRLTNRLKADWLEQLNNAQNPDLAFIGLHAILEDFAQNGATIYYVTAAISPIDVLSQNFLRQNQFPQMENFLNKGWFNNTEDFKVEAIEQLIVEHQPSEIILFGDNGEYDSYAYARIARLYPQSHIFIHKLYEDPPAALVPPSQNIYLTGTDLAVSLQALGFISQETVSLVLQETQTALEQPSLTLLVLPDWAEVTGLDMERVSLQTQKAPVSSTEALELIFFDLNLTSIL